MPSDETAVVCIRIAYQEGQLERFWLIGLDVFKDRLAPVNLFPTCRNCGSSDDESTWKFRRSFDGARDVIDGSPDLKETLDSGYLRHACRPGDDDRIMSLMPSNDQDIEEHESKDEAHR